MRVAYHSPLPPERSGVADYSALLVPALERVLEVDVVRPGRRRRRRQPADVRLFHIGNSPEAHGWILDALREQRGLVVLHELVVHHLVAGVTLGRGDAAGYLDAMQREGGVVGRLLAHGVIDGLIPPLWERRAVDFPLVAEVLAHADGLIVHSEYVERGVRAAGYGGRVFRIEHPAWPVPVQAPAERAEPRFMVLGHLNPQKRIHSVLAAFARLRNTVPDARLVVAGSLAGVDLDRELPDGVEIRGFVDEETIWQLLAGATACVNLRFPTMGETSGIAIRALSAGTPLVVSDVGWFAELPDTVALKIPVGDDEVPRLAAALELLARDTGRRDSMAAAARRLARTEHDVDVVADRYGEACEELAGGAAVERALVTEVATAAADVGLGDEAVGDIARAVGEVTRGD